MKFICRILSLKRDRFFFKGIENEMGDLSGEITHQQSFLKQLRQRILQEAVEGKLTARWREQHPELISGDNHASKLLEKIKAEKERLIKEGNTSTKLSARIKKDLSRAQSRVNHLRRLLTLKSRLICLGGGCGVGLER